MESKLGKVIYSITSYEEVKRAIIMPNNEEDPVLMVSLCVNRNNKSRMEHESLIRDEILPLVSQYLKSFSKIKTDFHHDWGSYPQW
jgi:dihydroorotase